MKKKVEKEREIIRYAHWSTFAFSCVHKASPLFLTCKYEESELQGGRKKLKTKQKEKKNPSCTRNSCCLLFQSTIISKSCQSKQLDKKLEHVWVDSFLQPELIKNDCLLYYFKADFWNRLKKHCSDFSISSLIRMTHVKNSEEKLIIRRLNIKFHPYKVPSYGLICSLEKFTHSCTRPTSFVLAVGISS